MDLKTLDKLTAYKIPYICMVFESRQKENLTATQKALLEFIQGFWEANAFAPSYREIQKHFGYKAVGTVQDHVEALIQKGALQKSYSSHSKKARALMPRGTQTIPGKRIPVFGEIAAGSPREALQTELGSLVIGEEMASRNSFALRVVGHSMVDIGIYEGDYVIVDPSLKIRSGDIVVALLDGETTVKRYLEKNGKIYLVPENKNLKPLEVQSDHFQIQGKVTGLQRKF